MYDIHYVYFPYTKVTEDLEYVGFGTFVTRWIGLNIPAQSVVYNLRERN